ncbi:MAG: LysM peptidoglycan-binding domain-containing protein [Anaerolineales bacterium]
MAEAPTEFARPPAPEPETSSRLGGIWIGVGLLLLAGIGAAVWFAFRSGDLETRAEINRLIKTEDEFSIAGDVAVVLALQDTSDAAWVQARAQQVHDRRPAPLPVPRARLLPGTLDVAAIQLIDDTHVQADVRRDFVREAGEGGSSETTTFTLLQFYRLDEQIGWVRTAAPESFWGPLLMWSATYIQVVYYEQDEAIVSALMPAVDELAGQACDLWGGCPAGAAAAMFLTNSPAVFLDDPTANTRVVLDTLGAADSALDATSTYLHIASPSLAGLPLNTTGRTWLAEAFAVRAIADLAEQVAGPGPEAGALYARAIIDLALAASEPGLRFERVATAAPPPAPTAAALTITPSAAPTIAVQTYVVQPGDALIRIAENFNTTVEIILAFNNIANADEVRVGQELIIPPPDASTPTPVPTATLPATATAIPAGAIVEYVVQAGDTVVGIATFYETTVDAIVSENGLANEDAIFVGQTLRVPVGLARGG